MNKSVWQQSCELPSFEALKSDIKTDVLIIGGGITGILTAYFLHQNGIKYVLVEKDRICSHTTQNTTAKITYQHGLIYHKIEKSYNLNTAKGYLLANKMAFEMYQELCKNIDCDYETKDNFVYSTDNRKALEDEINTLEKIGYNAEFCESINIPIQTLGAVKFKNQAQFNPLKFIASISKELNIYENTFVREMIDTTAVTDNAKIYADRVIVGVTG